MQLNSQLNNTIINHLHKMFFFFQIVGYPTLMLFHDGKHITEYSGPRKLEHLITFLLDFLHHTEL